MHFYGSAGTRCDQVMIGADSSAEISRPIKTQQAAAHNCFNSELHCQNNALLANSII